MSIDQSLRVISFALNVLCLAVWIRLVKIHPPLWPSVCIPLSLFVHTLIFYAVLIDRNAVPTPDLIMWSNGLRLHEDATWLIGGLLMGHVLSRAKRVGGNG